MYKYIYTWKPLYLDIPVNSSKSFVPSDVYIVKSIYTTYTFNNYSNFDTVTDKFWFKNILFITEGVLGFFTINML